MTLTRPAFRVWAFPAALATAVAAIALIAPSAQAKTAPLDGHLVANATQKGSKVQMPVLLTGQSAKKLKLGSPIATLVTKASKGVSAPNPAGGAPITVEPGTLRSGDEIDGKGKLKGSAKKLMPVVKAGKLSVTDRESAFSVDEVTAAVVGLYNQVAALGLRVDALESGLYTLRAEVEQLKAQNASLAGQLTTLLTQIADLETTLAELTNIVNGLPTAAALQDALDDIAQLQSDLAALGLDVGALETQLASVQSSVTSLLALCEPPSVVAALC